MKFSMKAVAAAVAFMAAGTANAAIDTFSTDNGELFFSVRDNVNLTSYVRDLNITINGWNGTTAQSFAADSTLSNFLAGGSGDYSWSVMAGDSVGGSSVGGLRYLTTAAAGSEAQIQTEKNLGLVGWSAMEGNYLLNVNPSLVGVDSATFTSADSGYFDPLYDTWSGNSPMSAAAAIGASMAFYMVTNTGSTIGFLTKNQPVDAIEYAGTWKLDANGNLNYAVSAVPVPAAAWLLGSALVGLVGVARRREETEVA